MKYITEDVEERLHAHLDVLLDVFSSAHETLNLVREIKLQHTLLQFSVWTQMFSHAFIQLVLAILLIVSTVFVRSTILVQEINFFDPLTFRLAPTLAHIWPNTSQTNSHQPQLHFALSPN